MDINQQLVEWATEIQTAINSELPIFAKEILNYKFYKYIYTLSLCSVSSIFIFNSLKNSIKEVKDSKDNVLVTSFVFQLFLLCFLIYIVLIDVCNLIKIITAPRLFIFEYIMDLIK